MTVTIERWEKRAHAALENLDDIFWNSKEQTYHPFTRFYEEKIEVFHYWWQAHAIDVLLDAFERTNNKDYIDRVNLIIEGVRNKTNQKLTNDFYDDMEWMALALLRAYDLTKETEYLDITKELWEDILTGWNDDCNGGFAWQKNQLYYKNTPANAPAVILALRLYQTENAKEYLERAEETFLWIENHLVDHSTGFVWDGMNREQDMRIDKSWEFTYCQGVYIGACVEYYKITGEEKYLTKAKKTIETAFDKFANKNSPILRSEGIADGGLFKGIFIRYVGEFLRYSSNQSIASLIIENGIQAWEKTNKHPEKLFGEHWVSPNEHTSITLSTHLSGCMLMESIIRIKGNTN